MIFRKYILYVFLFFSIHINAQDSIFARRVIDTLTSKSFNGRGYTSDGLFKTMKYISSEFTGIGLTPMNGKNFIQQLSYPVNYFPGEMSLILNGDTLIPGVDFIVSGDSKGLSGEFILDQIDSAHFMNKENFLSVSFMDKLTATVSTRVGDSTKIFVRKGAWKSKPMNIKLNIENRFDNNYKTGNICGYVKGKKHPDSLVVFTAHYDHLGGMGKSTYFPGANDNASGVALLLSLAKWYAKNPQSYSIGFICFTGEEAGLLGSSYFVKHPLVPLTSIRFLINLDLTGTGEEGITVVNATKFNKEFDLLKSINDNEHLLTSVNSRGKAKNSDHYWFTEKGVRSFFIYTMGGIKAYHDVYDVSTTLPNNEYADLFRLLQKFVDKIIRP